MSEQELESIVNGVMDSVAGERIDREAVRLMLEIACLKGYQLATHETVTQLKKISGEK